MVQIKPKRSKPFPPLKLKPMKAGVLNRDKAFGGRKALPQMKNTRTVKGVKKAISAAKWFKRNF